MKKSNIFWGSYLALAGVIIILYSLELFGSMAALDVILPLLMVPIFINGIINLNFFFILFPLAATALLFQTELGLEKLSMWPAFAAAALLSVGLTLIFPKKKMIPTPYDTAPSKSEYDNYVTINSRFAGSSKYITSDNLKNVNITATCSGLKVYFDSAKIAPEGAYVNVDLTLSGMDLYIPRNWQITNNIRGLTGSVTERGSCNYDPEAPKVMLNGHVKASGVNIVYI